MRRSTIPRLNIGKRFRLERRLRRAVVKTAIHNLSKRINCLRTTLIWYTQFLRDPFESQFTYSYRTVYERGPKYLQEMNRLIAIRYDLWLYYATL